MDDGVISDLADFLGRRLGDFQRRKFKGRGHI